MVDELISKDNCIWFSKLVCKIKRDIACPDDCDLRTLKFEKDEIINRMKEENENIKKLKKEGMFKNREKIGDLVMGVYIMQKALNNHFHHIEPVVVDTDLEKISNTMSTWRKKR